MDDRARDVKSGIVHTELPCEFCAAHPQYFAGDLSGSCAQRGGPRSSKTVVTATPP